MKTSNAWHLREIILLTLIAIFFGVIYWVVGPIYNVLTVALTPFGLGPAANDIIMGIWVMAGPLSGYLFKKVGAAFLGEFLGAVVEMFLGNQWGASTMISGVIQGVASELGFTFTGYKRYDWFSLNLSVLLTTIITFGWDMAQNGYIKYHVSLLIILFIIRLISTWLFAGLLSKAIINLLDRTHLMRTETR
ncbi:ECF transporter S component [Secundilactobacillus folii]|uniref:ABC transporter permease n=1 Tax=Secundilactobacillus folii TaxID=2678357 RepID=A0A7X2XUT3_9LACO|nr:ECF transporter S component [Secundilactobacillus folii]MTV82072.1 ABC transporter permease [Secundilactobacillus folii]